MLRMPGFTFIDLGLDGGPYTQAVNPKVCLHTTEGDGLLGAERAFAPYPPALGYDPRSREGHQYVDLLRHSYALRGDQSDADYIVQIELVGYAADTPHWPDEWYRNIGEDVVRPLRQLLGVPDVHLPFHGDRDGIEPVLASIHSPIRLTDAQLREFSGWLGHQHIPPPDVHWDPGGFLIEKAITYSYPPATTEMDDDMISVTCNTPNRSGILLESGQLRDITGEPQARVNVQARIKAGTLLELPVSIATWDEWASK